MLQDLYIRSIRVSDEPEADSYLSGLPVVRHLLAMESLPFRAPVTFLVGENGTGKSTLIEAIAVAYGFNPEGGSKNFSFSTCHSHSSLYRNIKLVKGAIRAKDGFFLRAESFYNVASYVDALDRMPAAGPSLKGSYGGKSLHEQSHGESFLSLIMHRFSGHGLYLLDEPEAALSPARQLALLTAVDRLVRLDSQLIIATHSPILLAYPGAQIYVLSETGIAPTSYQETEHYQLTKQFLNSPAKMLRYLLGDGAGER